MLFIIFALMLQHAVFAGQVPSHIYTADNIRKQNPNIEQIVKDNTKAYMAGANGPDTTNIMSYTFPLKKMGAESHYEKTGDLPIVMLMNAGDDKEQRAYAIGWMTHWINDYFTLLRTS
jgi:hypothetical protein